MNRFAKSLLTLLMWVFLVPAAALAQDATITGFVRDSSGAVLPGVTVEASSPALIEKSRVVTTDGSGQYRIVSLRPGVYTVTFTLAGFSVVRREGIELTGSFTATVNADMRVGGLEETVTVSGQAPLVDVQSVKQQRVLSDEVVAAIPSGRTIQTLAVLVPGVSNASPYGHDVGGTGQGASLRTHAHRGERRFLQCVQSRHDSGPEQQLRDMAGRADQPSGPDCEDKRAVRILARDVLKD